MRSGFENSLADALMSSNTSATGTIDETARRQFEMAWREKTPHPIEDFLPAPGSPHFLATLEELVQIDLEMRWKTEPGAPPRLEAYLLRFPQLDQPERVRRLLHQEYRIRVQQGERPELTEYQQRFPQLVRSDEDLQVTIASKPGAVETLSGLEGYDIVEVLGKGGMGVVYKARQKKLNRLVAVKTVLAGAQPEDLLRFMNEAEAVARLQHPHIVQIYEVNMQEGRPYFSMELVEGGNLAQRLKGGAPLPARDAARLVEQVTRAVEYAHARGIIHRDLKPANILLKIADASLQIEKADSQSTIGNLQYAIPKISDFGLAKYMDLGMGLTQTGAIVGTPSYMAPEQASGKSRIIGPCTDIHALGAILYELLTGRPPFKAATMMDTLEMVRTQEPVPPSQLQPKIPRDLETICLKCLYKEPNRRYLSAAALADDLGRYLRDEPIQARPVSRSERLGRWCRRHPVVAGLTGTIALLLLTGAIVATLTAFHLNDVAKEEARLRRSAEEQEGIAQKQTAIAETARVEAEKTLAEMYTYRGLTAHQKGDPAEAFLWFAYSARLEQKDPEIHRANEVRFRTWSRLLTVPARAFPHGSPLLHCVVHPRGSHLWTLDNEYRMTIWNIDQEKPLTWPGETKSIGFAAWSPDGTHLAVGTRAGRVEIRRFPDGAMVKQFDHPEGISNLAYSPKGNWLVLAGKKVRVWDLRKEEFATPELDHPANVGSLTFSRDEDRLITGCIDEKVRFFRLPGGAKEDRKTFFHRSWRTGFSSSTMHPLLIRQEEVLLTVLDDGNVGWWDLKTGELVRRLQFNVPGYASLLLALKTDPQQERLVMGGYSGARVWDITKIEVLPAVLPHLNYVVAMDITPDGETLLTASEDRTCRLWSVADGKPLGPSLGHQASLRQASFFPDGKRFVTVQSDGLVRVWDMPRGHPRDHAMPIGGSPSSARIAQTGRYVLPTGSNWWDSIQALKSTRVFEIETGKPAGPELPIGGLLVNAALAPQESQALTLCSLAPTRAERDAVLVQPLGVAGRVQFWDWRKGEALFQPLPMPSEPRGVNYSSDGKQAAVLCTGGQIYLLDTANGKVIRQLEHGSQGEQNTYPGVRFTRDNQTLISWGPNHLVRVWDLTTGKERFPPLVHGLVCYNAAPSRDGSLLVTGSWDHTARVWDLATGKQLALLKHPEWVFSAWFDKSENLVLTACRDGMARIWDWRKGTLAHPPYRHKDAVFTTALTADEKFVVTACRDGTVRLWDRNTARQIAPYFVLRDGRWSWEAPDPEDRRHSSWNARVTPDGQYALVGGTSPFLYALHLGDLTATHDAADLPLDDPVLLGELLSGFRVVEDRDVEGLTTAEWLARWGSFRERHPGFGKR